MARAELYDKQSVLDYYTQSGMPMYRVYSGYAPMKMQCRYEFLGDDMREGEAQLSQALDQIESNKRNTNVYCLQLIKEIQTKQGKVKEITKEIPAVCICFQINDPNAPIIQRESVTGTPITIYSPGSDGKGNDYGQQFLSMLQSQNQAMLAQMAELQAAIISLKQIEEEEEEEEDLETLTAPVSTKDKLLGAVGSFLERPQVQDALMMGLMGLASKFMPTDKKK